METVKRGMMVFRESVIYESPYYKTRGIDGASVMRIRNVGHRPRAPTTDKQARLIGPSPPVQGLGIKACS